MPPSATRARNAVKRAGTIIFHALKASESFFDLSSVHIVIIEFNARSTPTDVTNCLTLVPFPRLRLFIFYRITLRNVSCFGDD